MQCQANRAWNGTALQCKRQSRAGYHLFIVKSITFRVLEISFIRLDSFLHNPSFDFQAVSTQTFHLINSLSFLLLASAKFQNNTFFLSNILVTNQGRTLTFLQLLQLLQQASPV